MALAVISGLDTGHMVNLDHSEVIGDCHSAVVTVMAQDDGWEMVMA
jgi:hypothetical protein